MTGIFLQACEISQWTSGEWMSCIFDPVTGLIGNGLFGILTAGTILASFWVAGNRSLAAPSVAMIIMSGLAVPILPASYQGIAWTVAFIGVAAGVFDLLRRWML